MTSTGGWDGRRPAGGVAGGRAGPQGLRRGAAAERSPPPGASELGISMLIDYTYIH